MFCNENVLTFMRQSKYSLSSREVRDIAWALQKHREGVSTCFLNLGSLFFSMEDEEVKSHTQNLVKFYQDKVSHLNSQNSKLDEKISK